MSIGLFGTRRNQSPNAELEGLQDPIHDLLSDEFAAGVSLDGMESTSYTSLANITQGIGDWASSLNAPTSQVQGDLEQESQLNFDVMSIGQSPVENAESSSQISTPLMVDDQDNEYICYGMVG